MAPRTSPRTPPRTGARPRPRKNGPYGDRFSLFAECLWIGLLMTAASVAVVTWPAALAAGCGEIRRTVPDGPSPGTARRFLTAFRAALPGGAAVGAAALAGALFLAFDLRLALAAPELPGRPAILAAAVLAGAAALAVLIRACACHDAATGWGAALRAGASWTRRDLPGTGMLLGAEAVCAAVAWQLLILVPLVLGVLALAATAVQRRAGRQHGTPPAAGARA